MNKAKIGRQIQEYLEKEKITQKELARLAKVDQSQISRIINGNFRKVSKNVKRICKYAKVDLDSVKENKNPAQNSELMEAISLVWDGTNKNAKALATVIRSLKELS
ncbi:MAG TPA: helix-turn-helix transcriptional regulator [Pyrinomonadaceae bacterium]|nr:helix-turn-helix transcriptional regulator [Pyrinomonadaceae bacterium]